MNTDSLLFELLCLEEDIKTKTKRRDEIKKWCKEQGSFSTELYVCAVATQNRTGIAGLQEVIDAIGREVLEVHGLIKTSSFLTVHVSAKPIPALRYDV